MQGPLTDCFGFSGWSIKYQLLEPASVQDRAPPTQTVVFVHGTPWRSSVFRPLAAALQASIKCRVLLYDLPGYGESQTLEPGAQAKADANGFLGDTSVKAQARALVALLQHLGLHGKDGERSLPAVVAHDIAGTIALRAHLLHGAEFRSLLLLDTNCVLPWGDGFYKLVRAQPAVFVELPGLVFEAVVRAATRSACYNPHKLRAGWEDELAGPWIGNAERQGNFVRQIAQANDADVAEMLDRDLYRDVRCDVKIMWGEQDAWIPRDKMDKLAKALDHRLKEFISIPEAGHLIMIDQPERVTAEVISWLLRS